ncbi:MAG: hypothetical protein N3A53_03115, partial [Verrucomicrobiae bacterium]|nr:hypothetical protein [Verrucomicrobiae bacterium]
CGEAHGPQHAEFVFGESLLRFADGADDALGDVVSAADVVENLVGYWVVEQSVDGEIASLCIFGGGTEVNGDWVAAVCVAVVAAEGG